MTINPHANARPEFHDMESRSKRVATDIAAPDREPMAAEQARPPSNRKIGSKFKPADTNPTNPTRKMGWRGIGCARGTISVLGASHDSNVPITKLDLSSAAGTTGK